MVLVTSGLGFDGLDGWLHRRSGLPSGRFGTTADSVADAITFGAAPGLLVAVHPYHARLWAPYATLADAVGTLVVLLAVSRLVWFTLKAHDRPNFVGAPTPQNALALIVLLLFFADPAFAGTDPVVVLVGATGLALLMVLPIPFPKIRRGSPLRLPMTITAVALVAALLPLQFSPARGSLLDLLAEAFAMIAAAGLGTYYVLGPWTIPPGPLRPSPEAP